MHSAVGPAYRRRCGSGPRRFAAAATPRRRRRNAFLLQGPAILGMMLLGFVVYVGVMTLFTGVIQSAIVESITAVPTLYAYDADGTRITTVSPAVQLAADPLLQERKALEAERAVLMGGLPDFDRLVVVESEIDRVNQELRDAGWVNEAGMIITMYRTFAVPATVLLIMLILFTAAGHFWERGFGLWRRGAAADMMRGAVIGLIIIWVLPEVWDVFALGMTHIALEVMGMGGVSPQHVIDVLWCKLGASGGCMFDFAGILDPVKWSTALAAPDDFGRVLLGEVLMPFFTLSPSLVITLTMFVVSEVRIMFISIVLIMMPILLVVRGLPYIGPHVKNILDSLVGATIAPFFSALTLYVGYEYVSNTPIPSIEEWINVLGIIALAGAWPVMLAPFLSKISGQIQGAVQTAVTSSSMMAMQMGMGVAGGAISGASSGGLRGTVAGMAMGGGQGMLGAMPHKSEGLNRPPDNLGFRPGSLIPDGKTDDGASDGKEDAISGSDDGPDTEIHTDKYGGVRFGDDRPRPGS